MKGIKFNTDFESVLSPLERDVLQLLWPDRRMKVRHIYEKLRPRRDVALSSVAVILDRLFEKGVVDREIETGRGGIRYVYYPLHDRKQFERSLIETTVNSLIDRFGTTAVSYFNSRFGDEGEKKK
ncbi:BlaI/MecI/CopY family transcriptional regulator [Candidatus Woesearchaeota archaeon]|nr:BlaI/MecI/CopY family transcriptional regulator [Candidatus Woesearchaeota archaeon]